jgi:hypothetical protein
VVGPAVEWKWGQQLVRSGATLGSPLRDNDRHSGPDGAELGDALDRHWSITWGGGRPSTTAVPKVACASALAGTLAGGTAAGARALAVRAVPASSVRAGCLAR